MKSIRGTIPAHLLHEVTRLRLLEQALGDCLPLECRTHCRVAGLGDGVLSLVTDSPVWRTRLHFYSDRIIRHFNDLGKFPVHQVNIRVTASIDATRVPAPRRDPPLHLPEASARGFASLARETEDEPLRRALERIAARAPATGGRQE